MTNLLKRNGKASGGKALTSIQLTIHQLVLCTLAEKPSQPPSSSTLMLTSSFPLSHQSTPSSHVTILHVALPSSRHVKGAGISRADEGSRGGSDLRLHLPTVRGGRFWGRWKNHDLSAASSLSPVLTKSWQLAGGNTAFETLKPHIKFQNKNKKTEITWSSLTPQVIIKWNGKTSRICKNTVLWRRHCQLKCHERIKCLQRARTILTRKLISMLSHQYIHVASSRETSMTSKWIYIWLKIPPESLQTYTLPSCQIFNSLHFQF